MPSLRSKQSTKARQTVQLSIKFIDTYIGSGVFAEEDIEKGTFVCFYEGLLLSGEEGLKRYSSEQQIVGSFLFFFRHKGQEFCIDATYSQGYGRMINDSRKPNCKVVVEQKEEIKLAFYTIKDIKKSQELRFDYNDKAAHWRKKGAVKENLYQAPVGGNRRTREAFENQMEAVEGKEMETVEGIQMEVVEGNEMEKIEGNQMEADEGNQMETGIGNQMEKVKGNQIVAGVGNQMEAGVGNQMEAGVGNKVEACVWNKMEAVEGIQMEACVGYQMKKVEGNHMEAGEDIQIEAGVGNKMEAVERIQMEACVGFQMEKVEGNQQEADEGNQIEAIFGNQIKTGLGNQIEADEGIQIEAGVGNQMEAGELNQIWAGVGNQIEAVDWNKIEAVERIQMEADAGNQMEKVEGNQMDAGEDKQIKACVEYQIEAGEGNQIEAGVGNQAEEVEGNQMEAGEGNQIVAVDGNQMEKVEGNQMDAGEDKQIKACVEYQIEAGEGNQIEAGVGNQAEEVEGNQMEAGEGNQIVAVDGNQIEEEEDNEIKAGVGNQIEAGVGNQIEAFEGKQIEAVDGNKIEAVERIQMEADAGNQIEKVEGNQMEADEDKQIEACVEMQIEAVNWNKIEAVERIQMEADAGNQMEKVEGNQMEAGEDKQIEACVENQIEAGEGNQIEAVFGNKIKEVEGNLMETDDGNQIEAVDWNQIEAGEGIQKEAGEGNQMEKVQGNQMEAEEDNEIKAGFGNQIEAGAWNQILAGVGNQIEAFEGNQIEAVERIQIEADGGNQMEAGEGNQIEAGVWNQVEASEGNQIEAGVGNQVEASEGNQMETGEGNQIETVEGNQIEASEGHQKEAGVVNRKERTNEAVYESQEISRLVDYNDEEYNDYVESDDSFKDPNYVFHESDDTDTDEEDLSFIASCELETGDISSPGIQPKKQKTSYSSINMISSSSTDIVCASDNESIASENESNASDIIPDMSKFLTNESVSVKNQLNGTNLCATASLMNVQHENDHFGLLPKKHKQTGCKQVYDKINYCIYCMKAIRSKISRHLLSVHKADCRVGDILILPKRSPERMAKLELLANEGNFKHNLEVIKRKEGFLVVGRRESNLKDYKSTSYLPCNFCKKFILKKTLWLHSRNCSIKKVMGMSTSEHQSSSNPVRLSRQLLSSALIEEVDSGVSKLLSRMHHDEITDEVQKDVLIRMYAALKVESLGREQDHKINDFHRVSQSCRTLARVVIKCREKSEHIIDMDKLIVARNFDLLVSTAKSMCLNDAKAAPSLGKLIGNNISHIIQVKKGFALREGNNTKLEEAENFQRLFTLEWTYRVNSVCQKMTNTINRQKVKTIPLTEDLLTLKSYISESMVNAADALMKIPTAAVWTRLAKLTLCRLILFNKRRRAEVKDLKLEDFQSRPDWQHEQRGEFEMALSTSDRIMAKRMDMVLSAGKSRKNVDAYVLLPPDAKKAIELLNSTRMIVGISGTNPFLFARVNSDTPLSGNEDLKEILDLCPGLIHPKRITSTGLRRYIATVSQILDMSESELDALARHLGHDVTTHRNNYRLSHATRELTVVSQLLTAVDNGCVNRWKGKQLKEISTEELPNIRQLLDKNNSDSDEDSDSDSIEAADQTIDCNWCETGEVVDRNQIETNDKDVGKQTVPAASSEMSDAGVDAAPLPGEASCPAPKQKDQTHSARGTSKCGRKVPWSKTEEAFLRKTFKFYLSGTKTSVHNSDMIMAQNTCSELAMRTLAQIRSKLNNMKLGKSK